MGELQLVFKEASINDISTDTQAGGFSGYGSVFHTLDYHNDIVLPGAYKEDLDRFLSKGFVGGPDHNHSKPIGRFTKAFEDRHGLWVEASYSSTGYAQEVRTLISEGVIKSLSVGIMPLQVKRLKTKSEVMKYWSDNGYEPTSEEVLRAEGGARLIKRAKLLEVSPVALPANENAEIRDYKAGRVISGSNLETINEALREIRAGLQRLEVLVTTVETAQAKEESEEAEIIVIEDPLKDYEVTLASFRQFISPSVEVETKSTGVETK